MEGEGMSKDLYVTAIEIGGMYWNIAMDHLYREFEDFNKLNYKTTAIDIALEIGDREAFNKLVGSDVNG